MIKERDEFSVLNEHPFTASDRMLVRHLREDWGESGYWILLAAAFCNLAVREGHTYLDLANPNFNTVSPPRSWPGTDRWTELLAVSPIVQHEACEEDKPLVLSSGSCLYLEKYYSYERKLAARIRQRALDSSVASANPDPVQRAADQSFFVITGGPGTGKTTLALRYLDRLLDAWEGDRPARFAAIAPTGKAAARLSESIANGVKCMDVSASRKDELLSVPCLTIHRLLGSLPHRSSFRRNRKHPLRYDTLVIDESSMIDLPLMMRLFEALPDSCQVLLLGDKDQLASVDVGSVLSDILKAAETERSALRHAVERLSKTYRFSEDSGIYQLCNDAKQGNWEHFSSFLKSPSPDVSFHRLEPESKRIPQGLVERGIERHRRLSTASEPAAALARLGESMMLSPTRSGPFGTLEYNRLVRSRILRDLGHEGHETIPLAGEPIIVLENDYELELFNGDLGLLWQEDELLFACFESADGGYRRFRVSELPRHESAFALTIHKSQGSEFESVDCLFGPEASQNLTRELIYTAFSRAKRQLTLFADLKSLEGGIGRQALRATRLAELLGDQQELSASNPS
ncbi:exodeoxyribonuclease V subunit alpha [Pelagicoccus sp. NFK12]|uniref:Exodeoxyribonuclease V subunit alpha n=1 Tax=Pelagicoccus enzymogenes TaxID=2773457 RepID=A0A927FAZ3_9BACT|nr:exodeoxyribonuclease V subunit alpha [Pelagicoccus enzymogenes]MBD5780123.1 exodeoxyribonuclease V subunit alpha [Pelagicoccus enzymogenes]